MEGTTLDGGFERGPRTNEIGAFLPHHITDEYAPTRRDDPHSGAPSVVCTDIDQRSARPKRSTYPLEGIDHAPAAQSAERPREDRHIHWTIVGPHQLGTAAAKEDVTEASLPRLGSPLPHRGWVWVKGKHLRGPLGVGERQAPVPRTEFEDTSVVDRYKALDLSHLAPLESGGRSTAPAMFGHRRA